MGQIMPSSGCQHGWTRGAHGRGTAEAPGALREAEVGPPPPAAAPTLWSTSLRSLGGLTGVCRAQPAVGRGGLASCGADPHVHSFFPKKNLLHSFVPRLECSHMVLLAWAASPRASGMVVGLGHGTSTAPVLSQPPEPHSISIPHLSLLLLPPLQHICSHQHKAVVPLMKTNPSSPKDN